MTVPKIILLGSDGGDIAGVPKARFRSTTSLMDYDIVIWDTTDILQSYQRDSKTPILNNIIKLSVNGFRAFIHDINKRSAEFNDFFKMGKTLVLFMPNNIECYHDMEFSDYFKYTTTLAPINALLYGENEKVAPDGSGRETTFSVNNALPIKLKVENYTGKNIDFKGDGALKTYWEKMIGSHYYNAYLVDPVGRPFLFVNGTNKVVGTIIEHLNGVIIVLPPLIRSRTARDKKKLYTQFFSSISELVSELNKKQIEHIVPEWVEKYYMPGEKEVRDTLAAQQFELLEFNKKILQTEDQISVLQKYKMILYESGTVLEDCVAMILKEIGFSVAHGPSGRDDLIISYQDKAAVVEIKGVTKSAKEKDASQLEKWVSLYYENNDKKCKGILIVNAFCNITLEQRPDNAFPSQMIPFSVAREHCLITTTQLLGLYIQIKTMPESKDQYINELFETIGVYKNFNDYKTFLYIPYP